MRSKLVILPVLVVGTLCSLVAHAGNAQGVAAPETSAPRDQTSTPREAIVTRPTDYKVVDYPWGRLTWYVSKELKNSDTMTVGEALIKPGQVAPRHYHPNCDEVMHVVRGHIVSSLGNRSVEMQAGDTVTIPAGVRHNAKNIGTEDAILAISYSSANREVVGE
jgi:mannose-6-phosphate isomerase-like protein (cupin superfamily)